MDVEWRIGRAHAFGARGPGFDPTPKPRMAFFRKNSPLPSFRQRTKKLLNYVISCGNQ